MSTSARKFVKSPDSPVDFYYTSPKNNHDYISSNTASHSSTKQKRKLGTENTPATYDLGCSDMANNLREKIMSPQNPCKSVKISAHDVFSPAQRHLVKRNLNDSFGNSPDKKTSILNYSIVSVSDEEIENPLIIKLKVSERNNPEVLLRRLPKDLVVTVNKRKSNRNVLKKIDSESVTNNEHQSINSMRKSNRNIKRISYADFVSPIKSTPEKRERSKSTSSTVENTPRRSGRSRKPDGITTLKRREEDPESPSNDAVTLGKRKIVTPKKYEEESTTPTKNRKTAVNNVEVKELTVNTDNIHLDGNDTNDKIKRTPRGKTKSKFYFYESVSESSDNETLEVTPSKRTIKTPNRYKAETTKTPKSNLDDSIRKSILKTLVSSSVGKHRRSGQIRTVSKAKASCSDSDDYDPEPQLGKRRVKFPIRYNEQISPPRTRQTSKRLSRESQSDSENEQSPLLGKRRVTIPSRYKNQVSSPKTPRTRQTPLKLKEIVSDEEQLLKTPMRRKSSKSEVQRVQTPKTPKNPAKLIRDGVITPSLQNRGEVVASDSTPLMKARSQLHVSYVPTALPCREKEYCDVFNFLERKLLDGCGGCMYISGVPGTGKTATVTSVINNLLTHNNFVPKFDYVCVNGMRLTEPRQAYVEILKQLTQKTAPWEQAQTMLEDRFTKSKKIAPCVMLIDELDILCTKRQDVVYNLLDWPTKARTQLIVVTIANTMDLPERLLMSRVTSRLGLTRLTFQAYSHKQLQEIVTKRISGTDSFNSEAIQFVARKVASVSGDARRALDICRRAAEIAEAEGTTNVVTMSHVNEALNAMITQPKVRAIKRCSRLEQLLLQAVVAEVERTGVEETTFADVFRMLVSVSALDGFKMVSSTNALAAVSRLSASRLILTDQKCNDINQRIILNVSVDDVYYALKK